MKRFEDLSKEEQTKLRNQFIDEQDYTDNQKKFAKNLKASAKYDFEKDEYTPPS